ncbi:MAG: retropepsin-like domain-containing protein [Planctomycetes bacterium]|nr:retropepsin-like domain-containing protein [Planctomycetota bacterium]
MLRTGLLALSLSCLPQDPAPVRAEAHADPVQLTLAPYFGPLRTLNARIGDRDVPFLFDSGGGGTVVTPAVLKELGLKPFGRGTGFRHDGTRIDGQRAGPVSLQFGGFRYHGEIGALDLEAFGLKQIGGIASLQTFAGHAITLELAAGRLVVETDRSLAERIREAEPLQVRLAHPAGGAGLDLFVAITGEHGPQWFELDCGNTGPVLVAPHAWSELGLPDGEDETDAKLDVSGLGVTCRVRSKEMIYDGLLNAEFCARHVLTLDLRVGRAWAKAR